MIAFCLVSTDHGPLIVNRLDYNESNSGLYGVGSQILENGNYEPGELKLLSEILLKRRETFGDGVVALDCGANIGVHSVEWAKLMRGWGSVLAVEAQERIFYALAGNLTLQNCFNARALWAAVDSLCGEITIPEPEYTQPASFGSFELKPRQSTEYIGQVIDYDEPTLKVKTISIDSLNLPRVDLIKMDVEGMEVDALEGAADTIKRCKPHLFIETAKSDYAKIISMLDGYDGKQMGMNLLAWPK